MRQLVIRCTLISLALGVTAVTAGAQEGAEWDAQAVEKAVEKAKDYIWSKWSDGHWKEYPHGTDVNYYEGGTTALCAYALLASGESPQEARMQKTLKWLAEVNMKSIYARALRANVWAMLGRNSPYHNLLEQDTRWLVEAVSPEGAYTYTDRRDKSGKRLSSPYDNSNSQLAVLGVWVGSENGIEVPRGYWELVQKHWLDEQKPDGGWNYRISTSGASYGSMTAAGLATMFICFDELYRDEFIKCRANTDYEPIVRGLEWMDKNFSATENPGKDVTYYFYYLYSIERVGLASGYKYFGNQDWYKLITSNLLRNQNRLGGWGGIADTSFALLFLARGQHPVLFNKLKYSGSWNCRPRDLANFTRWVSRTFERPVNWQIIHLGVPVAEWHDAPILYISGSTAPKFTDEDIAALRQFVYQGGVIFSEAACSSSEFNMAMQNYYARLFPQYELTRLDNKHPIYDIHFRISRRRLMGVSDGVRLLAVHSPAEVSLAWQMNNYATEKDIFGLGANVYFYVTDKGSLRNRGVSPWPVAKAFTPSETVKVAVVRYGGNYNPEPLAWKRFSILMGNRDGIGVEVSEPVGIAELDASKYSAAAMTGTSAFTLSDEEQKALRKYIEGGGTLVVDAAGGSEAFADSAQKAFAGVLPGGELSPVPSDHVIYTRSGGAIERVSYRRAVRGAVADSHKPRLQGVLYKDRFAIIFSRDDLTAGLLGYPCWGLVGYEPDSAFALMRNILMYACGKTAP
ncbi:MAG: DUF4159 domain-containing protein [Sedimentisphaerales bacterium]|nr:DUF4159 domain-containing protein [Sedimentisphaerales bacterium]